MKPQQQPKLPYFLRAVFFISLIIYSHNSAIALNAPSVSRRKSAGSGNKDFSEYGGDLERGAANAKVGHAVQLPLRSSDAGGD